MADKYAWITDEMLTPPSTPNIDLESGFWYQPAKTTAKVESTLWARSKVSVSSATPKTPSTTET